MLLDDRYNQLERLLAEYPMDSEEYKRIQLLMFGYTDDEVDGIMFSYECDDFAEAVTRDDYLWDYNDICSGSIMRDDYWEHHYNNNDEMCDILDCMRNKIMSDSYEMEGK